MRKEFVGLGVGILAGATALTACNAESPTTVNTPAISRTVSPEFLQSQWENLPPVERLNRLLIKDYPSFSDFNPQKEIINATASAYCEFTKCNKSSKEMSDSVSYLNEDMFISETSKEIGRNFTEEEVEKEKNSRLAITTSDRKIFVNQDLMDKIAINISQNQPEIVRRLNGKDLKTLIQISTLNHEYTHLNFKKQSSTFDAFSLQFPTDSGTMGINFDKLHGFIIEGKDDDGKQRYMLGGEEAMVELASRIIQLEMGIPYLSVVYEYSNGSNMVDEVIKKANIPYNNYLRYLNGDLPSNELIEKIGYSRREEYFKESTDRKRGILIIAEIALAVQLNIPTSEKK